MLFNCYAYFLRLSRFPEYFWSIWNSPNLIFQHSCWSNVNKTGFTRDLKSYALCNTKFQSSEIVKILNIKASKLLFSLRTTLNKLNLKLFKLFFINFLKKAGTSFVLLFQSRNTIGSLLMKTCLRKPIENLYFLHARDFKSI